MEKRNEEELQEEQKTEQLDEKEEPHNKEKELNEEISKLKDELEDVKDRHTRLIAEFDNLKKRRTSQQRKRTK